MEHLTTVTTLELILKGLVSVQSKFPLQKILKFFKKKSEILTWNSPHEGLHIDKSMINGSSHPCKTYENESLTENEHFKVKNMEIWGLGH